MHVELLEEAEMSQIENAVTSSSKTKRAYRKRQPLSGAEKQKMFVSRKKETHKEVNVFVDKQLKDDLVQLCERRIDSGSDD
jgi:hypothetical protein